MKIGILGIGGRMGQALVAAVQEASGVELSGGSERPGHELVGRDVSGAPVFDSATALAKVSDVLIDFTAPQALQAHLKANIPLVIGTTGLDAGHHQAIDAAAKNTPVLQADNMSLGVNMLNHFVTKAAQALGDDWDIEILEMHHRHKVDAPSGTALMLGRAAAAGRGVDLDEVADKVRDGITGARVPGHIGFATLRGGSVPGDHDVIFAGEDEQLILAHKAGNRRIFARGAVKAAQWVARQKTGRYDMADMLGLKGN
ncbi:MAG: 4-hydroxy-tetrahydrodipicolinate reductase [Sphingomonadales bacterium]